MKVKVETMFNLGDRCHFLYWDDDIGAWNVDDFVVGKISVSTVGDDLVVEYHQEGWLDEFEYREGEYEMFKTSLEACNAAKEKNSAKKKKKKTKAKK